MTPSSGQGALPETDLITAEIRALRKGAGMGSAKLDIRLGPLLRELASGMRAAGAAEVRQVIANELATRADQLPEEPRTAILASLALSTATRSMPFFENRVSWLAAQLDRDRRTALRRINDAEKLLAEEIAVELHRRRDQRRDQRQTGTAESRNPAPETGEPVLPSPADAARIARQDWKDAPDVPVFFGRTRELALLEQWLVTDRCRLVSLTGMKGIGKTRLSVRLGRGGIGKTDLSLRVARSVEDRFDYIIWRRLLNAPKATDLVADLIIFLSGQQEVILPDSLSERVSRLLHYLRSARCLVILDNLESILQGGENAGSYLPGYEDYSEVFEHLADVPHQSSVLLTSREKIPEAASRESMAGPVRSLQLGGLGPVESNKIFANIGTFSGTSEEWEQLTSIYNGNPLALELAARHIREVFHGSLTAFLRDGTPIFSDLSNLLDWHFNRLSGRQLEVMYWLAINREPTSISVLRDDIVSFTGKAEIANTLSLLQKLVPLEQDLEGFTLQPVLMEYMTRRFIEQVTTDFKDFSFGLLNSHALLKTSAAEYVREAQASLVLEPVAGRLLEASGSLAMLRERISKALSGFRDGTLGPAGYAGGNLVNLLTHLGSDLVGYDFSRLPIWHAHLQNTALRDVDFTCAQFRKPAFSETFGIVFSTSFSPRGDLIAAGTSYGDVQLWSTADGALVASFGDHTDQVRAVSFSPDGTILATGSEDQTVRLWEAATGACRGVLRGHTGSVWSVAFSPNGNTLASTSDDRAVRLWDTRTETCIAVLLGHTGWIRSVAFSPDGSFLATGSEDKTVRVWETATGNCINVLEGHEGRVKSVAVSPDGQLIVTGSQDGTVRLWDTDGGQCRATLTGHNAQVQAVAVSPDGRLVASGGIDQVIRIWELSTGRCLHSLTKHTGTVYTVGFSPNGALLVSGGQDQTVRLWDISTGQCVRTLRSETSSVYAVAFNPEGSLLASGNRDNSVGIWDAGLRRPVGALRGHNDWVRSVAFSPDGRTIASGSEDLTIRLWDVPTRRCSSVYHGHADLLRSVAFSPDGNLLASASEDLTVRLWDVHSFHCLQVLHGHEGRVWAVAFTPDGNLLVSSADDGTVRIWDLKTVTCLRVLRGHDDWVRTLAISPDGQFIASGGQDQTVRLWDTRSGECRQVLNGHKGWVRAVAISPDGQFIASGGQDQTVRLWDTVTDRPRAMMAGHTDGISALRFSPRDGTLASGSHDGTIRIWDPASTECLAVLRGDRPYERMNISNATGLTEAQRRVLKDQGAIDR